MIPAYTKFVIAQIAESQSLTCMHLAKANMKLLSFQSKASVVCSVTAAIFIDFCLKKLNVFSQHRTKNKLIFEFGRTNPQELKFWSTFCVNNFLRYYLMMQHQSIVKRVNETHEWARRSYQLLSAPFHYCLYKHTQQIGVQQAPACVLLAFEILCSSTK